MFLIFNVVSTCERKINNRLKKKERKKERKQKKKKPKRKHRLFSNYSL